MQPLTKDECYQCEKDLRSIKERHDKGVGNYDVVSSCESNNSNSKSEYFAAISPTAITSQPYPQMNFSRNGGILTMINDQAVIDSENDREERNNCSPLSEYNTSIKLHSLKHFYIRQNSNAIDTFLGFLRKNRFVVEDMDGNLVYHVFETSDDMCECDCQIARYSQLHFTTSTGEEEIRMQKVIRCSSFFGRRYPFCCIFSTNNYRQIMIESPPGFIIGKVVQQVTLIRSYYQVEDTEGNLKYFIIGSTHNFSCYCDMQYEVISADNNTVIGIIMREWTETSGKITTIDNFNISCLYSSIISS